MNIIRLTETDSTNTYVSAHSGSLEPWTIVSAIRQTGGRGQRGNSWEAEEGKNLTFSMLVCPENFAARDQFAISEAVALAVVDTLGRHGIEARVKWPNDIYSGDLKICGILIEHKVTGMNITATTAGVGLNVNQTRFVSDAPNPVSMAQIAGHSFELDSLLDELGDRMKQYCLLARTEKGRKELHESFKSSLWRGDGGFYPFKTPSGKRFEAMIDDIETGGYLILRNRDGEKSRYAFKEVIFILETDNAYV